jgi:hypothetical protein
MKKMNIPAFLLALAFCIGITQQAALAQSTTLVFGGSAYGTDAFVSNKVLSGKTSFVTLGDCSTTVGAHVTNSAGSVNVPPLFTTGAINTGAMTSANMSQSSSHVQQLSSLSGLITADNITAASSTTDQNGALKVSAAGSSFTNLVVAGNKIQGTPDPNTKVDLTGLGYVILNEQHSTIKGATAKLVVNMIHVFVTETNVYEIPKGAQIIVADAASGIEIAENAALDGFSYGTRAFLAHTIISGPSALEVMPCLGTDGEVRQNSTASVNVPKILKTGTVKDTVQGTVSASSSMGETTSTVNGSNLVNGLLTAKVIKADSNAATTSEGKFTFNDTGSKFLGLKVSGHPEIHDDVAPNTKVKIAGLGTLWLHRVIQTDSYIEVRMVELVVTETNSYGIKVGTDVRVANAHVSLDINHH